MFLREYNDYLDIILAEQNEFMNLTFRERGDKIQLISNVEKKAEEIKEKKNLLKNLEKNKLILDYVDNPKLLWQHLKVPVRNMFYERYIIQKQLLWIIKKDQGGTLRK